MNKHNIMFQKKRFFFVFLIILIQNINDTHTGFSSERSTFVGTANVVDWWRDEFNYTNIEELWEGWYHYYAPYGRNESILLESGYLVLENKGIHNVSEGDSNVRYPISRIFDSNLKIMDFRFETSAKWIDHPGSFEIIIWTKDDSGEPNCRYSFGLINSNNEYWISRNYISSIPKEGWRPTLGIYYTFIFERKGSTFYASVVDGDLDRDISIEYSDLENQPDPVHSFGIGVLWHSAATFDYVNFTALTFYSPNSPDTFPENTTETTTENKTETTTETKTETTTETTTETLTESEETGNNLPEWLNFLNSISPILAVIISAIGLIYLRKRTIIAEKDLHIKVAQNNLPTFIEEKKLIGKSNTLLSGHLDKIENEGENYHAKGRIKLEITNINRHLSNIS